MKWLRTLVPNISLLRFAQMKKFFIYKWGTFYQGLPSSGLLTSDGVKVSYLKVLLKKLQQGNGEMSELLLVHEPEFLVKWLSGKTDESFGQTSDADHQA